MKIAVFFPGIGYHCDKPLLYYCRKAAMELGYDKVVTLSYSYDGDIRGNKAKMQDAFEVLYKQAWKELQEIPFEDYDEILFVSKSVGTIIASSYAVNSAINCRHILYTPLEYTFEYPHENCIAFIGTADPWSNVEEVIRLANEQGVTIHTYEGLNHSLEGDSTKANMDILADVIDKSAAFIKK